MGRPRSATRCRKGTRVRPQPPWPLGNKRSRPQPKPTQYATHHVPFAGVADDLLLSLMPPPQRDRPGERSTGADEKETSTMLCSPTRWRRKPRRIPPEKRVQPRNESPSPKESLSGGHSQLSDVSR